MSKFFRKIKIAWNHFWHPMIVVYNFKQPNSKYSITIGAEMETTGEVKYWCMTKKEALYMWIRLSLALFGLAK